LIDGGKVSLVYSSFRRVEGVNLLMASMDVNGYARVVARRDPASPGQIRLLVEGDGSCRRRYMAYDNSDPEAASILLNAFNSDFDRLPEAALADARRIVASCSPIAPSVSSKSKHEAKSEAKSEAKMERQNLRGELAQVLLVTKSGSQGINLKHVREVHVVEPFWHANRVDQVIGRAVRANSHTRLPPDERHVRVYLYLATFTETQAEEETIKNLDAKMTTDQNMYALMHQKKTLVDNMLRVLKMAAVDCRTHHALHAQIDRTHACLASPVNVPDEAFSYPLPGQQEDDVVDAITDNVNTATTATTATTANTVNTRRGLPPATTSVAAGRDVRLIAVRVGKQKKLHYMDPGTKQLYDYDALKNENILRKVVRSST